MSNAQEQKWQEALAAFRARDLGAAERACGEILRESPRHSLALQMLGMLRLVSGNPREAASLLARAAENDRDDAALQENLGLAHLALGEHRKGETAFRQALRLGASHALLHMRLGLALGGQGRHEEALAELRTAAEAAPEDPDVHLNLGNALAEQGKPEEALACYRRVLALHPRSVDAHYNIGTLLQRMGRHAEAIAAYQAAVSIAPDFADAHHNLGMVYQQLEQGEQAAACYRKALELDPGHVPSLNNLGNALRAQGRRTEAVALYERAMKSDPAHADAYINLGAALAEERRYEEARPLYEKALELEPASIEARQNLGVLLKLQGNARDAVAHLRRVLEADPQRTAVLRELAGAYRDGGDLDSAIACQRRALELDSRSADARFELAETLKVAGRLDEAVAHYAQALELDPDHVSALNGLIHARQHLCDWYGLDAQWERLRGALAADGAGRVTPFSVLSLPSTAAEQLACATAWARAHVEPFVAARSGPGFDFSGRGKRDRIRIGYLSWGFHRHATTHLTAELFELHDRERFEIFAYAYGPDDGSAVRARVRGACDGFADLSRESHTGAARRIHGDGVDILVDLTGYTLGARPQILALRPAPVQVNWLGYPGTLGTRCAGYIIADPFVIPSGSDRFYAEKVVRLPDCYQVTDRRREVSERVPSRAECGLPPAGVVFCCFNHAYKILPEMFGVWMRVLEAVPGSVLWLAQANPWQPENLRREAQARGVAPERLVFAPRKPLADYLVQYRIADLALDTFPYTSHTLASDALWMGCPLATCAGETFASRVAGSVLSSAGLPELVAGSLEDYERLVIGLATAPARLQEVRRRVAVARESRLFDTARFARNLEDAYREMFAASLRVGP